MKKALLAFVCGSVCYMGFAQDKKESDKGGLIIKGGVNMANISVTSNGRVNDANTLTSFHVGLIGDIYLAPIASIQTGLLFTGKGAKTESGQPTDVNYYKATFNPYYLELPFNLVLKFPLAANMKIFAGAGPYVAMGIGGKNKVEGHVGAVGFSSENSIKWSNDDPTTMNYQEGAGYGVMRRFDYGLNGTAGAEFDRLILGVNYGYGLAKLQSTSNSSSDNSNKHRVLSFSVGIKF